MHALRTHGWRLALVASGVLTALGGSMHPQADAKDAFRQELATMTADERWVPGHALLSVAAVLFVVGLAAAYRSSAWPRPTRRMLGIAALVFSAYVVETVAHLAAVVDSDALSAGESAPVAMTHVGMSVVIYPVAGWTLVALAWSLGRTWGGWRRVIAVVGVVSGLTQAFSVPLTMLLPDAEVSGLFLVSGVTMALFSLATGLVGTPPRRRVTEREPELVA